MLNRKIAPDFQEIQTINFIQPEKLQLTNSIPVFLFNVGEQELVRIEWIFNQVNWNAEKPLVPSATCSLINSGTKDLSAAELANKIDYYGAFLQVENTADQHIITLYTLTKHLKDVLPLVYSCLNEAIYPAHEIDVYKQNHKQSLMVNLQKNDYVARREFANQLFGTSSYGSKVIPSHFDALEQADLLAYYKSAFQAANCTMVIAGKFGNSDFAVLNEVFGKSWNNQGPCIQNEFKFEAAPKEVFIEKADAIQSAIRLGCLSITRKDPDFPLLQILNTALGGYFGSRLMRNIREDKGYTYGIGSNVASLKHVGYFFLATEVGTAVCASALQEIEKEVQLLRTEEIPDEELALVKNYMLGALLGSLENAFSHADKFKNLYFSGLDYSYYERYIETVKNCTAGDLLLIAQKYLEWDNFTKIIVGKK